MFIRKLSTYNSPEFLKKIQKGQLAELTKAKMLKSIHEIFEKQQAQKLIDDLTLDDDQPAKKAKAGAEAASAQAAGTGKAATTASKKAKKKAKAEKALANKEKEQQEANEKLQSAGDKAKVELTVKDDIVIIKESQATKPQEAAKDTPN